MEWVRGWGWSLRDGLIRWSPPSGPFKLFGALTTYDPNANLNELAVHSWPSLAGRQAPPHVFLIYWIMRACFVVVISISSARAFDEGAAEFFQPWARKTGTRLNISAFILITTFEFWNPLDEFIWVGPICKTITGSSKFCIACLWGADLLYV